MKKFVGNVNGVSYENWDDFNKAAVKAMADNDGNLSITSYYKYSCDDKKELPQTEGYDIVDTDYVLTATSAPGLNGKYEVSEELGNKIKNSVNKDDVLKNLNFLIGKIKHSIFKSETDKVTTLKEIDEYENKITELKNSIEESIKWNIDLKARKDYYEKIKAIIESCEKPCNCEKPCDTACARKSNDVKKSDIIDDLFTLLNKIDFFRK